MVLSSDSSILAYSIVNYIIVGVAFFYKLLTFRSSHEKKKIDGTFILLFFSAVFFTSSLIIYLVNIARRDEYPDNRDEYEYAASKYMISLIVNGCLLFISLLILGIQLYRRREQYRTKK